MQSNWMVLNRGGEMTSLSFQKHHSEFSVKKRGEKARAGARRACVTPLISINQVRDEVVTTEMVRSWTDSGFLLSIA